MEEIKQQNNLYTNNQEKTIKQIFVLFLVIEAIFFFIFGLLYQYAPDSSYFWYDGLGGVIFNIYDKIGDTLILLTPVLLLFNILMLWLAEIRKIKGVVTAFIYIELVVIIAMIPLMFMWGKSTFFSIVLVSSILSFILQWLSKTIILFFKKLFTVASIVAILYIIMIILGGAGAA